MPSHARNTTEASAPPKNQLHLFPPRPTFARCQTATHVIPPKVHHVLFDFDYTLADSSEGIIASVNYALQRVGEPIADPQAIRHMIGHSLESTFGKFLPVSRHDLIPQCKSLFMEHADSGVMVAKTVMLDGVRETLEELHNDFYALGIVSTKRRLSIEQSLEKHDLLDYFDVVIGYEDVGAVKPDPEGLLKGLAELAGDVSDSVYVGDSLIDVEASRNAGLPMIGVATGMTPYDVLSQHVPCLTRLAELPARLAS